MLSLCGPLSVQDAQIDMSGNCGNMLQPSDLLPSTRASLRHTTVRIFNTNTSKIIHARFPTDTEGAVYGGDCVIPGVAGSGAPIRLNFLNPGGATTGKLVPTGKPSECLLVNARDVEVSMIDAGNACVFVRASDVGMPASALPSQISEQSGLLSLLENIRIAAYMRMGISDTIEEATRIRHVPFMVIISEPQDALTTSGEWLDAADMNLTARVISNGHPQFALPLTATLCTAIAASTPGSIVESVASSTNNGTFNIGMPSGILSADAEVVAAADGLVAKRGSFFRTARRLFKGDVFVGD